MKLELLEQRALLAAVGPDGYGYVADPHPLEEIDLVEGESGVVRVSDLDGLANWADFRNVTFNFYGHTYHNPEHLFPNDAGLITFGTHASVFHNNKLDTGPFHRVIAPLWDAFDGPIMLAKLENTAGDARPDRLIVQWSDDALKVQAILELNTGDRPGDIIFNYVSVHVAAVTDATVGIKDLGYQGNRLVVSYADDKNELVGAGKAVRIHNPSTGQPIAHAGGTKFQDEGQSDIEVQVDGSRSRDPNQSPDSLTYAWDFDLDGIYGESAANSFGDENGITPTFHRGEGAGINDATFPIVLRVTDQGGFTSYSQAAVVVRNLPPHPATISGPTTATPGVPLTIDIIGSDPRGDSDLYDFHIDWGDSSLPDRDFLNGRNESTQSHTYYMPGTHTITVTTADNSGAETKSTHAITVSALPDLQLTNKILMISGTEGQDTITLDQDGSNLRLTRNGVVTTYPLANVDGFSIDAGGGSDTITASITLFTTILGGEGNDTIDSSSGDRGGRIDGGQGSDSITNDGFLDLIDAGNGDNFVQTTGARIVSEDGHDTIIVTAGGVISSGDGDDSITGGGQQDTIDCGNGSDTVNSGSGDDIIIAEGGEDAEFGVGATIDSGPGNDRITARYTLGVNGGDHDDQIIILLGAGGDVNGGAGNDLIRVNSSFEFAAVVLGGDGNDTIFTGDGHDSLIGGAGRDKLYGGLGSDRLSGGGGGDFLYGQGGADRLYGGVGADMLTGHRGNDWFVGGAGADTMNGGPGIDFAGKEDLDLLLGIESQVTA